MNSYDVVIVGGATSGSYLARRLVERGASVLVIDMSSQDEIGNKYDIFHVGLSDFDAFGLPRPEKGDDYAFEFTGGAALSALGNYPKKFDGTTVGMHVHRYTLRMNKWAMDAGAEILYRAKFRSLFIENNKVTGITYDYNGKLTVVHAKLIVDCSGIAAVVRTSLPKHYGIETFGINSDDMLYVTLRYVHYLNENDYVHHLRTWNYYKTWEAPESDPTGAILGVGSNGSFDEGEKIFRQFEKAVKLPEYELKYIEKGTTPYRRPPYSLVADGVVVTGDAGCLNKPSAGEGVTSAMVHIDIIVDVVTKLLKEGKLMTRHNLWPINEAYMDGQGKAFASQLAMIDGMLKTTPEENDYFFKKDVVFSKKVYEAMGNGESVELKGKEAARTGGVLAGGVLCGKIKPSTLKKLLASTNRGSEAEKLYSEYPSSPEQFDSWVKKARLFWKEI